MKLDSQRQLEALEGELASSRQRGSEFEGRAIKLEAQVASLQNQVASSQSRAAETEYQLALLKGAQDIDCTKAFRIGVDETWAAISRKYPKLDFYFLEAEEFNIRTPATEASEESEYEDILDAEADDSKAGSLPSEVETPETRTFEIGGPSQASPTPVDDSPEIRPAP